MGPGTSLVIRPNGTKTVTRERSGPFVLTASADAQHSCLPRLIRYLQLRFPAGQITAQFLFSPLARNQQAFEDQCLTASAMGKRITKHIQDAQLYAGESNHGFRRGQIQGMVAAGMDRSSISQATQIRTLSVVDLYADLSRHVPRLHRLQKRTACPE